MKETANWFTGVSRWLAVLAVTITLYSFLSLGYGWFTAWNTIYMPDEWGKPVRDLRGPWSDNARLEVSLSHGLRSAITAAALAFVALSLNPHLSRALLFGSITTIAVLLIWSHSWLTYYVW